MALTVKKIERGRIVGGRFVKNPSRCEPRSSKNPRYFLWRNQSGAGENIEAESKSEAVAKARRILSGMLHDRSGVLYLGDKTVKRFGQLPYRKVNSKKRRRNAS